MDRNRRPPVLLLLAAAALAVASCSKSPTAPEPQPDGVYQDPLFVEVVDGGAARANSAQAAPQVISLPIDGERGGRLEFGRYRLDVPGGAWTGVAQVTLKVPDASRLRADLVIEPAPASLAKPLELRVDCRGAIGVDDSTRLDIVRNNGRDPMWYRVSSETMSGCGWELRGPVSQAASFGVLDGRAGW